MFPSENGGAARRQVMAALALATTPLGVADAGWASSAAAAPAPAGGDFGFFMGDWRVRHRRLKRRLAGSTEWETFDGACTAQPILGGQGNIDDNVLDLPGGAYRALTLRLFDPAKGQWAIYWVDARNPGIEPPVFGRFEGGVGTFFGDDVFEGRPIKVRFIWSETASGSPHWAQAFSSDGGASWETNWTMRFVRAG